MFTPVKQVALDPEFTTLPVTQAFTNNVPNKVVNYPAMDIRVKKQDGIEITRKPPRKTVKKDVRDLINKKRKASLPREDAQNILNKIKPLS